MGMEMMMEKDGCLSHSESLMEWEDVLFDMSY